MDLAKLFGGSYYGRRVLVTGHTGFKGSWLALWLQAMGARVAGLSLDPDTTPNHWLLLGLGDVADLRADLRDAQKIHDALTRFRPEIVFHLAAQPLVRRSYRDPVETFASNVLGLVHLFEAIRNCPSVAFVVNATTDKVYENLELLQAYRESDQLGGHDPYSTSKACAELVSVSYRKSFFAQDDGRGHPVRLATARAGNVIGGGDWAEDRLVPDLVRAVTSGQPLLLRNPKSTRPWQHVLEPLSGYLRLGQALSAAEAVEEAWNFGPRDEDNLPVQELVTRLGSHWPALRAEMDTGPKPHEAGLLHLDWSKAKRRLGWQPVWDCNTAIARTAGWYRSFRETARLRSADDLRQYAEDANRAGLSWAQ